MKAYKRICIKDFTIRADNATVKLLRGKEYTTSRVRNGTLTVYTNYWIPRVPKEIFAGRLPL